MIVITALWIGLRNKTRSYLRNRLKIVLRPLWIGPLECVVSWTAVCRCSAWRSHICRKKTTDKIWRNKTCAELGFKKLTSVIFLNKKHLKNVGPIRHNEPPHAHSADIASGRPTVARRLRIDVYDDNDDDDNDNAWQRGPLWPHGMGPITSTNINNF